jgi:CheY-like chemotaxis protein
LVVDDNKALTAIIQMILESEGYDVKTGDDGEAGYLVSLLFRPDLVITDIQMPERDGFEMMEQIRVRNPSVKTIYMSGELERFQLLLAEEERRYGVHLLTKPFNKLELTQLVSETFKGLSEWKREF